MFRTIGYFSSYQNLSRCCVWGSASHCYCIKEIVPTNLFAKGVECGVNCNLPGDSFKLGDLIVEGCCI